MINGNKKIKVPEGWTTRSISDLGDVRAGRQRSVHIVKGSRRPYLRVANVLDGTIDSSDIKEMPFSDKEFEIYRLDLGDILLNEGQSLDLVGRPAVYMGNPPNCAFQNTLVRLRPSEAVDAMFTFYLVQMLFRSGKLAQVASRTTSIAHLGVARFSSIPILLPPLPEQRGIAEILGTWDDALATLDKLIEAKQRFKRGLAQKLLSGQLRFKEFKKEKWREVRLGDVAEISMGQSPPSSDYNDVGAGLPLLQGMSDIRDGVLQPRLFSRTTPKTADIGDVLMSVRAPVGSVAKCTQRVCIGRGLCAFTPRENIHPELLWQMLCWLELQWHRLTQGSTFMAISGLEVRALKVVVPESADEQERIAKVLASIDAHLSSLQEQRSMLEGQKRGIMSALLSGSRRVAVDNHRGARHGRR